MSNRTDPWDSIKTLEAFVEELSGRSEAGLCIGRIVLTLAPRSG
jgi:hypothetical protein